MTYKQYMTDEYDEDFEKVKELKWHPWVGKDYHKTGIFVVGMSTDKRDGGDWTQNPKYNLGHPRNASRALIANVNTDTDEPFKGTGRGYGPFGRMANTFIDGVGVTHDENAYGVFSKAIAFNNFFQVTVETIGAWPQNEVAASKQAFYRTCEIIKPKLVLFWENDISFLWPGHRVGEKQIGRVTPQVFEPDCVAACQPIVGIGHASRMKQSDCLEFLRDDPASKDPIKNFLKHLKQQIQ